MKTKSLLFALIICLAQVSFGQYLLQPEDVEFDVSTGTITDYLNTVEKDIEIPSEINGVTVTAIGIQAFQKNALTSVTIPNSVISIGEGAFSLNQLTSIEIPNSLTTIDRNAFSDNALASITIPNSVTSIGDDAFAYNQLTSVVIPNSVTSIGDLAFNHNQLTSADIPNSVTSIGTGTFAENVLTSVDIPNSVTSIGWHAFAYNALTSVTIPNSVTSISYGAFQQNHLTSVELPNSVTYIGLFAFANNQLTSVKLPNSVTIIDGMAFARNQLTSVDIPNSVTRIDEYAFHFNQLTSVVIPNSVTEIGKYAFASCPLTSLTINQSIPLSISEDVFFDIDLSLVTLCVPIGSKQVYSEADVWKDFGFFCEHGGFVSGIVYNDENQNCTFDSNEVIIPNGYVKGSTSEFFTTIQEDKHYYYHALGENTFSYISFNELLTAELSTCANSINVESKDSAYTLNLGVHFPTELWLSVHSETTRHRRCFRGKTDLLIENIGVVDAQNVHVKVDYPEYVIPISANHEWIQDSSGISFIIDSISAFSKIKIAITDSVMCGDESIRGFTQCIESKIMHVDNHPSFMDSISVEDNLEVKGECSDSHTVNFQVINKGEKTVSTGDRGFRVYANARLARSAKYTLEQNDTLLLSFEAEGETVRLELDETRNNPFQEVIVETVEGCGADGDSIDLGYVNQLPMYDESLLFDVNCSEIVDSYDPNDKQVFPRGVGEEAYVLPNTELEYFIRFQNTGTDTAYKVVLVDTLSDYLEGISLQVLSSSHPYTMSVTSSDNPVFSWTFDDIDLVDSTTNEAESHGYIRYSIKQKPNLPNGTVINNKAEIYFDFNSEIVTNTTLNTVMDPIPKYNGTRDYTADKRLNAISTYADESILSIYPNPSKGKVIISSSMVGGTIKVYDTMGRIVGESEEPTFEMELSSGVYIGKLYSNDGKVYNKQFIVL